jgi:membrane protease YdiL (CAAX protease family)
MVEHLLFALLVASLSLYAAGLARKVYVPLIAGQSEDAHISWGAGRALLVFVLFLLANVCAALAAGGISSVFGLRPGGQADAALAVTLIYVLSIPVLLSTVASAARSGNPLRALGFPGVPFASSLRKASVAFLLFVPFQVVFPAIVNDVWLFFFHRLPKEQDVVKVIYSADLPLLVLMVLAAVVIAPIVEELVFRAYIQRGIEKSFGKLTAVVATAALFSAVHGDAATAIKVFPLALALSVVYDRTRNIVINILFHALFNASGVLMLFLGKYAGLDFGS